MRLFRKKVQFYKELPPSERIEKVLLNYISPQLANHGYTYLKSKKQFKKVNDFFNYEISWFGRKFNYTDGIVEFNLVLSIRSPKFLIWEKDFYNLSEKPEYLLAAENIEYLELWNKKYLDMGWYDLEKYDNQKIVDTILANLFEAGFNYFENFTTIPKAIDYLNKYPIANFEKIIDLYLFQDKVAEAKDFFNNNCSWHLEQDKLEGHNPNSNYSLNRKASFELRREILGH
jgi:hypothetical protein